VKLMNVTPCELEKINIILSGKLLWKFLTLSRIVGFDVCGGREREKKWVILSYLQQQVNKLTYAVTEICSLKLHYTILYHTTHIMMFGGSPIGVAVPKYTHKYVHA
jgi:hypothetical protein